MMMNAQAYAEASRRRAVDFTGGGNGRGRHQIGTAGSAGDCRRKLRQRKPRLKRLLDQARPDDFAPLPPALSASDRRCVETHSPHPQ